MGWAAWRRALCRPRGAGCAGPRATHSPSVCWAGSMRCVRRGAVGCRWPIASVWVGSHLWAARPHEGHPHRSKAEAIYVIWSLAMTGQQPGGTVVPARDLDRDLGEVWIRSRPRPQDFNPVCIVCQRTEGNHPSPSSLCHSLLPASARCEPSPVPSPISPENPDSTHPPHTFFDPALDTSTGGCCCWPSASRRWLRPVASAQY